jgi:hypothetical protein
LISGAEKVETAARMGNVALLLHAADAAGNGRRSLDQAWRVGSEAEGSSLQGLVLPFDRDQLSLALGRSNCVHIAIMDDRAAARIGLFLFRLLGFRGVDVSVLTDSVFGNETAPEMTIEEEPAAALI